ncbi:MAG: hypothetical protein J1F65_02700 [Clostridiales bacterium]|nr:hypothetical protein [Clostridiales bacterium]
MVERIVNEVATGLRNRCYISALTTALTLPDICGKAKYTREGVGARYTQWLNDYVCTNQPFALNADADIMYDLRCRLLHEGNPSIAKNKVKQFSLIIRENSPMGINEAVNVEIKPDGSKVWHNYNVDVVLLCEKICEAALTYYRSNKERFDFFDYRITNTDYRTAQTFGLSEDVIKVKF